MSMAAFRSELRSAVRDARQDGPATPPAPPARLTAHRQQPAKPKRTVVRLWLPLTPLWVLLSPFAIVFCPLLLLAPDLRGMNPLRAALAIGGALFALSGTLVDVDTPDALVRIRIY